MLLERLAYWRSPCRQFSLTLYATENTFRFDRANIGYKFRHNGKVIFTGQNYSPSAMSAIDTRDVAKNLLGFLSLRPGDTDRDYFDSYTPEQMEFATSYGEELSLYTMDDRPLPGRFETL